MPAAAIPTPTEPASASAARSRDEIGGLLRDVARRRGGMGLLATTGHLAGALGVAALVGLGAAALGAGPAVIVAGAAVGLAAVAVPGIVLVAWPALRRSRSRRWSARAVDRRLGSDAVLCAVELYDELAAGAVHDPFSVRRLESHLQRTAIVVRTVRAPAVVGWRPVERLALAGPVLLAAAAIALALPGAADRLFGAFRPVATVAPFRADAAGEDLVLRDVEVHLVPPAYTGEPARTLPSGTGAFAALPGTEATVEARVGAAVEAVTYQLGEGPTQAGTVVDRDRIRVAFVVGDARSYRIQVSSPARAEPLRTGALRIDVLADAPPVVRLVDAPDGELDLDALEGLTLSVHAEDDHGLSRVDSVLLRDGAELQRTTELRLDDGPRGLERQVSWVPPAASPGGGPLALVLEVFDNDTVGGPKATRSQPVPLRSFTADDRRRQVLDAQHALFERTLAALGEHLLWQRAQDRGDTAGAAEGAARAAERMEAVLASAGELREAFARDPEPDPRVQEATGTVVDELARTWDLLRQRERRQAFEEADEVDRQALAEALDEHVGSLERAALTLDRLLAAARWEAVRHASREAARAMEALRQAMTSGDQAAVDRALAELQRRMQELSRAMAALDAGQAREVANATAPGSADADLAQQVRELMEQGRVDEAMELLSRASSSMASMEAMQGSGMSPEELAALQAQLEGAVDQAAELVQRQERLNEGLEALNDQYPDAEEPAGTETLLQELEALRAQLAGIERWGMDPRMGQSARDRLERADRHLEDAGRGLSWADADRALRGISRSDQELLDLIELAGIYHQAEATGLSQEEFDAYAAELQAAEAAHMALIERLLAAERGWREARSEAAMAGLDQAQQQGALADDAGTFRDSLDQLGPQIGGAGTARRELGEAERWMRASAGDVELGLANRALEGGTEALQRLQTVERELRSAQEMMQAGGGASMPMASAASGWQYFDGRHGGAGMSSGTVDVPSAERFQTPEELRRAALEAALEDAPPEYRELNEAYYEELLR